MAGQPDPDGDGEVCPDCTLPATPHCTSPTCPWLTCTDLACGSTWHPGRPDIVLHPKH